ncbi:unnamed protein product [Peniophora sp. CBMAI 1063]|nr:unnamed protein product [Peniophora sp. CBMAI 1063]
MLNRVTIRLLGEGGAVEDGDAVDDVQIDVDFEDDAKGWRVVTMVFPLDVQAPALIPPLIAAHASLVRKNGDGKIALEALRVHIESPTFDLLPHRVSDVDCFERRIRQLIRSRRHTLGRSYTSCNRVWVEEQGQLQGGPGRQTGPMRTSERGQGLRRESARRASVKRGGGAVTAGDEKACSRGDTARSGRVRKSARCTDLTEA